MKMKKSKPQLIGPDKDCIEKGAQYCFFIDIAARDFAGQILDKTGAVRWRFETSPRRSPYSPLNVLRKPNFVVRDADQKEVLTIRRTKRFLSTFVLADKDNELGTIKLATPLKNRYTIVLTNGPTWTVWMPLFTVHFIAWTDSDHRCWIRVGPSKRQWNLLLAPRLDSIQLLSALAFIHREWWSYS